MKHTTTYSYKLTIIHYNSLEAINPTAEKGAKPLNLDFEYNSKTSLTKDVSGNECTIEARISSLVYHRNIYDPNEITAQVNLTATGATPRPTPLQLRDMFLRKPVTLTITTTTKYSLEKGETGSAPADEKVEIKAENYFVYEVIPEFKSSSAASKSVDLTLKIFSLDKLMTLDKYSQAYLGRKFRNEILQSVNRFTLDYPFRNSDANIVTDSNYQVKMNNDKDQDLHTEKLKLQHLAYLNTDRKKDEKGNEINEIVQNEFIQPYLVQYNESFYDFIRRISNRCGEFLYFENGQLNIGLKTTPDESGIVPKDDKHVNPDSITVLTGYSSLSFENISKGVLQVKEYARDSMKQQSEKFGDSDTTNYPKDKQYRQTQDKEMIYKFSGEKIKPSFPKDTNLFSDGYKSFIREEFLDEFNFTKPSSLDSGFSDKGGKEQVIVDDKKKKDGEEGDKETEKDKKKDSENDSMKESEKDTKKDSDKKPEKDSDKEPGKDQDKEPEKDPDKEPEKKTTKDSFTIISGKSFKQNSLELTVSNPPEEKKEEGSDDDKENKKDEESDDDKVKDDDKEKKGVKESGDVKEEKKDEKSKEDKEEKEKKEDKENVIYYKEYSDGRVESFLRLLPGSSLTIKSTLPIENIEFEFDADSTGILKDSNDNIIQNNSGKINIDNKTEITFNTDLITQNTDTTGDKKKVVCLKIISIATIKETEIKENAKETYHYNNEIAHDEFFMPLYSEGFGQDKFFDVTYGNKNKFLTRAAGALLNANSFYDFIAGFGMELIKKEIINLRFHDKMTERGQNRFIKKYSPTYQPTKSKVENLPSYVVPFSEDEMKRWTTLEYYTDIKVFEEAQQKLMVSIDMDSNLKSIELGDIFSLDIDPYTPYVACEIEISLVPGLEIKKETVDVKTVSGEVITISKDTEVAITKVRQHIRAIPMYKEDGGWKAFPPVIPQGVFRKSGPQAAYVVDAADPKHQSRVRIRYPWQTNSANIPTEKLYREDAESKKRWEEYNNELQEAATPWIRMITPSATTGAGIYFEPEPGDEVMVNYENDNIERPFVVGAVYSKDMLAPAEKGRRVIVSKYGHMIRFKDPSDAVGEISDSTGAQSVFGSVVPMTDFLSTITGNDKLTRNNDIIEKMTGGIDLTDSYGIYKISMSSNDREINILSPFGTVNLNAFTGISISAPNGDIKIVGKNIDIKASNKINIESGTNLKEGMWGYFTNMKKIMSGDAWYDFFKDKFFPFIIDLSLYRSVLEVFIRPVNGTLSIKSHGFVKIEAGEGKAEIPKENYKNFYAQHIIQYDYKTDAISLVNFYKVIDSYINKIDKIVDSISDFTIQVITAQNILMNGFFIKYINSKVISSYDRSAQKFVDKIAGNTFPAVKAADLIKRNLVLGKATGINLGKKDKAKISNANMQAVLNVINNELRPIWDQLHDPNIGVGSHMTANMFLNHIDDQFKADYGDNIAQNLSTELQNLYNAGRYLFLYYKFAQNEATIKELLSPQNQISDTSKNKILTQGKLLKRYLIWDFLTKFNTFYSDFILDYDNTLTTDRVINDKWVDMVQSLQIRPIKSEESVSVLDNIKHYAYIAGDVAVDAESFFDSWGIWKDVEGLNGKILMSDNKRHTIKTNDNTSMLYPMYNNIMIEESNKSFVRDLKKRLNKF